MFPFLIAVLTAIGYALGSIPSGLLVGRARGIDIRAHGSGNIGATNVFRVLGKKWGLVTFGMDAGKGFLAVTVAQVVAALWPVPQAGGTYPLEPAFAGIAAALGCIIGHNFPVWLGFKGGKGVATSVGVMFGLMPVVSLLVFAIWGLVFKVTKYVSLASLVGAATLPIITTVFLFGGWLRGWGYFYFALVASVLVFVRHTGNIERLLAGTEHRFGTVKVTPEEVAAVPPGEAS